MNFPKTGLQIILSLDFGMNFGRLTNRDFQSSRFLILRIAIYSELGNLESFIAKQKTRQIFAAKRTVLPQLKAYFGGFYFLSRIMNYEKTLQCNFYEDCKNGECQVAAKKECLNEKATLRAVAERLLQEYSASVLSLDDDFKTVMNSDEYAEATPVSTAYMLGRDFYTLYQKKDIAREAYEFVAIKKSCHEIVEKSAQQLAQLCQKIESLVQIPKDVNDQSLKDAVTAALAFAEFFNAKSGGEQLTTQTESERYVEIDTYLRRQTNDFMQAILSFFSFYTPRNLENQ